MNVHGYELEGDWKNSTSGMIARATRGGKRFLLKRYNDPVAPLRNGALSEKAIEMNQRRFDAFVSLRNRVNAALRPLTGEGGNIIVPCDTFMDENRFVEVSEFIPGAVPDKEIAGVLETLPQKVRQLLMMTAASALAAIHGKNIVHSDLKLKNVLLVKNRMGNYVAKIIDFDNSYFVDTKPAPEDLVGTIDYYSPEHGAYTEAEDEEEIEELGKKLTVKTDIFSLGLIFHQYLSGEMPTVSEKAPIPAFIRRQLDAGKVVYSWVALRFGCELALSPKIENPVYVSLIRDMLAFDPDKRPTANEVLQRLREVPTIGAPWPEDGIVLNVEKLKTDGIVGLKQVRVSGDRKYELLYRDGTRTVLDRAELAAKGLTMKELPKTFPMPWPEHAIAFDETRLRESGFVGGEQTVKLGVRGYTLVQPDAGERFFRKETLLQLRYAVPHAAPVEAGPVEPRPAEPWPEHAIVFDEAAIRAKGFVRVERREMNGVKGYAFFTESGSSRFLNVTMVRVMKLAKQREL